MDIVINEDRKDHLNPIDVHQQDIRELIQLNLYKFLYSFVLFNQLDIKDMNDTIN